MFRKTNHATQRKDPRIREKERSNLLPSTEFGKIRRKTVAVNAYQTNILFDVDRAQNKKVRILAAFFFIAALHCYVKLRE